MAAARGNGLGIGHPVATRSNDPAGHEENLAPTRRESRESADVSDVAARVGLELETRAEVHHHVAVGRTAGVVEHQIARAQVAGVDVRGPPRQRNSIPRHHVAR